MSLDEKKDGIEVLRKRKPQKGARVAARVARFKDRAPHVAGVVPLNAGFFHLQRLRSSTAAQKKGRKRAKVKGK